MLSSSCSRISRGLLGRRLVGGVDVLVDLLADLLEQPVDGLDASPCAPGYDQPAAQRQDQRHRQERPSSSSMARCDFFLVALAARRDRRSASRTSRPAPRRRPRRGRGAKGRAWGGARPPTSPAGTCRRPPGPRAAPPGGAPGPVSGRPAGRGAGAASFTPCFSSSSRTSGSSGAASAARRSAASALLALAQPEVEDRREPIRGHEGGERRQDSARAPPAPSGPCPGRRRRARAAPWPPGRPGAP